MKRKVTVYGSLLEGLGNWYGFLNNDQSTKLGEHVIEGKFKMISLGGFPGLIPDNSMTEDNKIFVKYVDKNTPKDYVNSAPLYYFHVAFGHTDFKKARCEFINFKEDLKRVGLKLEKL